VQRTPEKEKSSESKQTRSNPS